MNDLLVNADARTAGESAVTEKRGLCAAFLDVSPDDLIKLVGGHTDSYFFSCKEKSFAGDPSRLTHQLYLFGIFELDHFLSPRKSSITSATSAVVSESSS